MRCERCGDLYEPMQALENTQMDIYERVFIANKYDTNARRKYSWQHKQLCPTCANEFQTLLHKPKGYLSFLEKQNSKLVREIKGTEE